MGGASPPPVPFGTRQAPARANFEAAFKQALGTLIGSAGGQLSPILQRSSGDPQAPRGFSFCLVALEDTEVCAGAAGRLINPKCHSRITSGCITIPKNMLTLGHCSKWQLPSASATAQHSVASVTMARRSILHRSTVLGQLVSASLASECRQDLRINLE